MDDNTNKPGIASKAVSTGGKVAGGAVDVSGKAVQASGAAVEGAGAAVQASGAAVEASGAAMQATGKAAQVGGTAMQAGGKALDAGGKGLAAGGQSLMDAGAAASSTGVGAIAGVPMIIGGALATGAGYGAQGAGKGMDAAGGATKAAGKGLDSAGRATRNAGKNIRRQGNNIRKQGKNIRKRGAEISKKGKNIKNIAADAANTSQEATENAVKKAFSLTKMLISLIVTLISMLPMIILIVTIIMLFSWIMLVWEFIKSGVEDFFSSIGHWFAGDGWCANEAACAKDAENRFNEKVNDLYEYWKQECGNDFELDTNVLIAAATYSNPADVNNAFAGDDPEEDASDAAKDKKETYKLGKSNLDKLSDRLVSKRTSGDTVQCENNYQSFYSYLTSSFISENYDDQIGISESQNANARKNKIEMIADEIISYSVNSIKIYQSGSGIYEECPGVTVKSKDGSIEGTYDLETYVAGVLAHEVNENWGAEALKAQAIAARTFTLARTNNCKNPIENSESDQTFEKTENVTFTNAVQSTIGLVMVRKDNGEIFSSEYSAWYGKQCIDQNLSISCNSTECTSEFMTTGGKTSKKKFTMPIAYLTYGNQFGSNIIKGYDSTGIGGHCRGMFQFGARYLDKGLGYGYEDILNTFYEEFNITSLTPAESTGIFGGNYDGFPVRDERSAPTYATARQYFNYDGASPGHMYQCPWYAKGRALEILSTVTGVDEDKRQQAIKAVQNTMGNGGDWYGKSQNGGTLSIFGSSTDVTKPKPGSIVSWYHTPAAVKAKGWDTNYGHVAIVERVEGDRVFISEGWSNCWGASYIGNESTCRGYQARWWTYDEILTGGGGKIFQGYVYLLN